MQITKELIEQRISELGKQKEQFIQNAIATDGAIQDNKFWLEWFATPEKNEKKKEEVKQVKKTK